MEEGQLYSAAYGYFNPGEGMEYLWYKDGGEFTEDDEPVAYVENGSGGSGNQNAHPDSYWSWDSDLCQRNVSEFEGVWYYDGDLSAEMYVVIDGNGDWSYYQRAPGAEKFLDIKCRYAGIAPSACVLVATVRALKSHGGVAKADLNQPDLEAVKAGAANLVRHIDNLKNGFGLPVVVAINAFPTDTPEEQAYVEQVCAEQGVPCVLSEVFAKGGEGGKALAEAVLNVMEDRPIQYTYPLEMPLKDKVKAIATKIYRADGVNFSAAASKTLAELTEMGYGNLPVCIAKTQYSFSDNAKLLAAPTGFTMEVREVRLAAGAGFVVVICGNIMTMPGLPKKPAAVNIDVDADGKISGLF